MQTENKAVTGERTTAARVSEKKYRWTAAEEIEVLMRAKLRRIVANCDFAISNSDNAGMLKALQGESTAARDAGQWEREVAVKGNLTKGQTIDVLCDTIQEMERLRAEVIRLRDLGGSVSRKLDDATTEVNRLREQLAVAKSQIDNHDATVEQVRRIERSKSKANEHTYRKINYP
jgi:hypothetical protein